MDKKTYLISACLLGLCTRYDGGHNRSEKVLQFCNRHICLPICPEQLGGLPTPRPPAEISGGDGEDVLARRCSVIDRSGNDVTGAFLLGARQTLMLARLFNVAGAVLKARSPSCGLGCIHDGTFRGSFRSGDGVTAALLKKHGYHVLDENELAY
ncbi:MAG TPA: DUF523 domain-containing protein [Bacillota bacterium]|nr:DUF523 domain-containing protein [Bacillota bacterium]